MDAVFDDVDAFSMPKALLQDSPVVVVELRVTAAGAEAVRKPVEISARLLAAGAPTNMATSAAVAAAVTVAVAAGAALETTVGAGTVAQSAAARKSAAA